MEKKAISLQKRVNFQLFPFPVFVFSFFLFPYPRIVVNGRIYACILQYSRTGAKAFHAPSGALLPGQNAGLGALHPIWSFAPDQNAKFCHFTMLNFFNTCLFFIYGVGVPYIPGQGGFRVLKFDTYDNLWGTQIFSGFSDPPSPLRYFSTPVY